MANAVAKGQVDLEVNKDKVTKDIGGLGSSLTSTFGKLGELAGGTLGGGIGAAVGKVVGAMPGGPLGAVTAGVVAGSVAIGVALFGLGKEFDTAYKSIQKQTGATGKEFEALQSSFKNVAKQTGASFDDIASAVGTVSQRTGATGKDLEALSLSMLRMSSITGKDLGSVLESTTKLFNNFQIPVEQMPAAMDKLYLASAKTGVGVDQLSASAQQFGPTLRQLGFGFDESVAMLASFDKAGVNTSKVMGGMTIGVANLAAKGEKDIPGAFAKAVDAISKAQDPTEAMGIAIETFGKRAGPQLAEAVRGGALSIDDLTAQLGNAEGALGKTAKETATFEGKMSKFKNQMKVAFEPAAMGLFDAITDALMAVTPLLTKFAEITAGVIRFLTQNRVVFITVAAAMAAMGIVIAILTIKAILATTAFGALAVAVIAATWPFVLIIAGIAALVIGFTLLYTKVDWFRSAVQAVWNFIKSNWPLLVAILLLPIAPLLAVVAVAFKFRDQIGSVVSAVIGFFKSLPGAAASALGSVLSWFASLPGKVLGAIAGFGGMLIGWIVGAIGALVGALTGAGAAVFSFFAGMPGRIVGSLGSLAGSLGGIASSAIGAFVRAITGGAGEVFSFFSGLPGRIVSALGNVGSLLTSAGKEIVMGLARGITGAVGAVTDAIGGVVSKVKSFLPFSPAKVGPLSGRGDPFYSGRSIAGSLARGIAASTGVVSEAAALLAGAAVIGGHADYSADGALGGGNGATYQLVMNVSQADVSQMQSGFRRLELLGGVA